MKFVQTQIPDVLIIEPALFCDDRGWFMESFNENVFRKELQALNLELPKAFVQDNHSSSRKGVLRGLHYQIAPHAQGKLVRVVQGAAFDVAVDLRKNSSTYLKWVGIELNEKNKKMLWIPEGFAHGFIALEDNTQFLYKTTGYYNPKAERSLLWNDPSIQIEWPVVEPLTISEKDATAPGLMSL